MADNLREKLPTKNSIIAAEDKVILSQDGSNTTVDEFGRITFNEENFPTILLNTTTDRVASLSSYIETTTVDKLTSFETPEILALQYKHSSNAEGDVIGIAGHAITDINFEEHVNTIEPVDLTGGVQISKNAATKTIRDRRLASSDILLSPGVYRVECTGTFTLVGIAGGLDENGNVFGNGYKSYVVLELHKETQPGEILLYSTPAVEYSSEKNINDSTSSVTCYMYGYISICNPSVLKLKAKTAGEYAIGTVDPDSAGDFPDTFINPVQLVFEKVCDDPFCMEVSSGENDVFPGFIPFETTTLPPAIPPPPPLIPGEDPTVTTTTTTTLFPLGGGAPSAPPPPGGSGGGSDPGGSKPRKFSDTINCGSVGFCTSSPFLLGLPKWGYVKPDGSYQRTTIEQAGWSWFSLLDKNPGTVVDADYNSRVIFEGGKRRHNGGIMGNKPGPGDALIYKTFPAEEEYSFSSFASRDRGECDYCRQGGIGNPAPTSLDKLVINKWKHSREEWCHLLTRISSSDTGVDTDVDTDLTSFADEESAEKIAEEAAARAKEAGTDPPDIAARDGSGVPGKRLPGETVKNGTQLVQVKVFVGKYGRTWWNFPERIAANRYVRDADGDGYVTVPSAWADAVNSRNREAVNPIFRKAQEKALAGEEKTPGPEERERIGEEDDPGEDKCAVTLAWPCFVRDFGTDDEITEKNMESGQYEGKKYEVPDGGASIEPDRVGEELKDIFGDVSNVKSRSVDEQERIKLIQQIDRAGWFSEPVEARFASYGKMKENYVLDFSEITGIPVDRAREQAETLFDELSVEDRLLWRTKNGDADDESEDIAVIFEDKILPLLKNIQLNPPTTYDGIYLNQNILNLFSSHLRDINISSPYDTVVSSDEENIDYIRKFVESIKNIPSNDKPTPYAKFFELSKFIANTKYYEAIIKLKPPGGFAGVEQWRNNTGNIPPNIYFNRWWESRVFKQLYFDLDLNPLRDLIAGEGKEPEEYRDGNCCMTKNAMIIEAYYWNLDQFRLSNDDEYKFVPWWFKFSRDVGDNKTHKYEQEEINKYNWIKKPVDLLGIINHPHPYADTAEATITQRGEFVLGCQD